MRPRSARRNENFADVMKILLVDDHTLFREGLRFVLSHLEPEAVILEACDFAEALCQLDALSDLDLILLDLHLPGSDGWSALDTLTQRHPAIPVVIVSASSSGDDIRKAIRMGAMGYIPKTCNSQTLVNALRLVLSDNVYLPPAMLEDADRLPVPAGDRALPTFSGQQQEVLRHMLEAKSNKGIARELGITESTVKFHVSGILRVLNVGSRAEAILAVTRMSPVKHD